VLGQVLEVVLPLEDPFTWQKWCFCHPALRANNLDRLLGTQLNKELLLLHQSPDKTTLVMSSPGLMVTNELMH
jgi:hypothetical protein